MIINFDHEKHTASENQMFDTSEKIMKTSISRSLFVAQTLNSLFFRWKLCRKFCVGRQTYLHKFTKCKKVECFYAKTTTKYIST